MKVAIFGGTGFVGSHLVEELIKQQKYVNMFARKTSTTITATKSMYINIIQGDISSNESIQQTIHGCDVVIYCIGILREFVNEGTTFQNTHFDIAKKCIDISVALGIKRFIMISANGANINGTDYQRTKCLGEEYLKKSSLVYTIFRPSVIFGTPDNKEHKEFTTVLKKNIIDFPLFAPSFFKGFAFYKAGHFQLSPIFIGDVVRAIISSIDNTKCKNQTYAMCGKSLTWNEIINILARYKNKSKVIVPIPVFLAKLVAIIFSRFHFFPTSKDELTMLMQGNTCDKENDIFALLNISKKVFGVSTL